MSGPAWPSVAIGALGGAALALAAWRLAQRRRPRARDDASNSEDDAARASDARRDTDAAGGAGSLISLLRQTLDEVTARLEEVQLPLHILLASPFGELNENQEEMLGAANAAADAADQRVRLLRKLVALDADDAPPPRRQPIALRELLRAPLAIAEARAAAAHAVLRVAIAEAPRRVLADPSQAQEALTALLVDAVGHAPPDGHVLVEAADDDGARTRIVLDGGGERSEDVTARLARRLIERQGGRLVRRDGCIVITLPAEEPTRLRG